MLVRCALGIALCTGTLLSNAGPLKACNTKEGVRLIVAGAAPGRLDDWRGKTISFTRGSAQMIYLRRAPASAAMTLVDYATLNEAVQAMLSKRADAVASTANPMQMWAILDAGDCASRITHTCSLDAGARNMEMKSVDIEIAQKDGDKAWYIGGEFKLARPGAQFDDVMDTQISVIGNPRHALLGHKIVVEDQSNAEHMRENIRTQTVTIDTRTLAGTVEYKRWSGYTRLGKAAVKFLAPIQCVAYGG